MISILIPVKDFDIVALVESMKRGLGSTPEYGEIIIGDDGSSAEFRARYLALSGEKVKVVVSETNIGRAAIRNRLISEAKGDQMLIIDADAMVPGTPEAYLQAWLPFTSKASVISGGIIYREVPPGDPDLLLRWHYGRKREQKKAAERNKDPYGTFTTFNVLIDKQVFSRLRFNEELKQYGHEDTLFGYQLKKAGIKILHIDNGLLHEGLETNMDFL
ncbi:MAG: glycosyltransferase, partial [Bacteroidales bacterium]|nr:glycosyltransferase [Bacteroidales bacterium]